jgi:hypothetical protein
MAWTSTISEPIFRPDEHRHAQVLVPRLPELGCDNQRTGRLQVAITPFQVNLRLDQPVRGITPNGDACLLQRLAKGVNFLATHSLASPKSSSRPLRRNTP